MTATGVGSIPWRSNPNSEGLELGPDWVQGILEELKARGCLKVNLQVLGSNRQVVEFYRKNGFTVEDRIGMGIKLY